MNERVRIVPTVGRVIHFFLNEAHYLDYKEEAEKSPIPSIQPYRADICLVHPDGRINIAINFHDGTSTTKRGVPIHYEGDQVPAGPFCMWMKYQQGQAAKTEAATETVGKQYEDFLKRLNELEKGLEGVRQAQTRTGAVN